MSIYVTFISKTIMCPKWHIKVPIDAKYGFFDKSNPSIAKYINCKCPIMEEIKNARKVKNKSYPLIALPCGMEMECIKNIPFKSQINFHDANYRS